MYGIEPWEFYQQYLEEQEVGCANGAYVGSSSWDGERFADAAIADEQIGRAHV